MTEIKRIRVRRAKTRDIGLFQKLWRKLLEHRIKEGSIILANEKTMAAYKNLFNTYIENQFEGIVLFVADKAVTMWGDSGSPFDCQGKLITNWGLYVEPTSNENIKDALLKEATKFAKEKGFTKILTEIYENSETLEGFELVSTLVAKELESN